MLYHRAQFEVVCNNGILKVDDLVGGQGHSGNFSGDYLGKDEIIKIEACNHDVLMLVEEFSSNVSAVKNKGFTI